MILFLPLQPCCYDLVLRIFSCSCHLCNNMKSTMGSLGHPSTTRCIGLPVDELPNKASINSFKVFFFFSSLIHMWIYPF